MNRVILRGAKKIIECLVLADGSSPAWDFIRQLETSDQRKLAVLFSRMAEAGEIRNKEKFKKIEGSNGIYEFKSFQIRIPCFFTPDGRVVLTFGLVKKSDKWKPSEITKAEEYRRWYLSRGGGE